MFRNTAANAMLCENLGIPFECSELEWLKGCC
jgi:hypothetical protein